MGWVFVNLHGETVYGESVNFSTGAVVPVNVGRSLPVPMGTTSALTAVKFTQALSQNVVLYAGKINTIDNLQQPFMRGRGLDAGFMNGAFLFNPVLGRTIPYSAFGTGAAILVNGEPVVTLTVYDSNDASTTSVFNDFFSNGAIIYPTVSLPTTFFGMPGHQSLWGAYSSGSYGILTPDSFTLFPPGIPQPTAVTRGSWWITYLFDQALWVDPKNPSRRWGLFGNAGISDGNPNPIGWAAVVGLGGSSPFSRRRLDGFGVAYYYLGLDSTFKNGVQPFVPLSDEHGFELFYKIGLTPYCYLTPDLQVVTPTLQQANASLVIGLRAKIDF